MDRRSSVSGVDRDVIWVRVIKMGVKLAAEENGV